MKNKGITLIALVVTIIVLIILASTSLTLIIGDNGIMQRAKQAKKEMEIATLMEAIRFKASQKDFIDEYDNISYEAYLEEINVIDSSKKLNKEELNIKISTGNGSWSKGDIYQVVGSSLYYFDKTLQQEYIGELWERCDYLEFNFETRTITGVVKEEEGNYKGPSNVIIPKRFEGVSVNFIGKGAFSNLEGITSIEIRADIEEIPDFCFTDCSDLTEINLSQNVIKIGKDAFMGTKLKEFTIPNSVNQIERGLFNNCKELEKVRIEANVDIIKMNMFYACDNLKSIVYTMPIKQIEENAFYKCKKLETIELKEGLETIGNKAFYTCELLNHIILPKSISSIGDMAFYNCTSLEDVTIEGNPSMGSDAFRNCPYQP